MVLVITIQTEDSVLDAKECWENPEDKTELLAIDEYGNKQSVKKMDITNMEPSFRDV